MGRQMNYSVGSFLAYWINYACTKNASKLGDWDWKIVQIFQLLAPVLIIIAISFCPETPRVSLYSSLVEPVPD